MRIKRLSGVLVHLARAIKRLAVCSFAWRVRSNWLSGVLVRLARAIKQLSGVLARLARVIKRLTGALFA